MGKTKCQRLPHHVMRGLLGWGLIILSGCQPKITEESHRQTGITAHTIRLGSVLALKGQEEALGNGMKVGLEAALKDRTVQGRRIELVFENDYYDPSVSEQKTRELLDDGIFLMIGNVGTPTAEKTLPILSEDNVPAVGFFTGASVLRSPSTNAPSSTHSIPSNIVNYRASYAQEIAKVVDMALNAGVQVSEICAYVQNDGYGMAGLKGLRDALSTANAPEDTLQAYDQVLSKYQQDEEKTPTLNGIGPVGVYTRNTPYVSLGYQSLKQWEKQTDTPCKLVVTAGTYSNVARFVNVARRQQEPWVISALSFTGAEEFQLVLEEYGVPEKVVMTQVVPFLDSGWEIVEEAKSAIDEYQKDLDVNTQETFGYVALEGYIVGKMVLEILDDIPGELNRDGFLEQAALSKFDLGGIDIDLTQGRPQASDLVKMSVLRNNGFTELEPSEFVEMFVTE